MDCEPWPGKRNAIGKVEFVILWTAVYGLLFKDCRQLSANAFDDPGGTPYFTGLLES
jgi:hypothetical protein